MIKIYFCTVRIVSQKDGVVEVMIEGVSGHIFKSFDKFVSERCFEVSNDSSLFLHCQDCESERRQCRGDGRGSEWTHV